MWRRAAVPAAELADRLSRLAELHELVYRAKHTPEAAFAQRPDLQELFAASYSGDRAFGRTVQFFQELDEVNLEAAWRALLCPVLALHGERDWVTTEDDALAIAALARAGCSLELAGVDHELREVEPVLDAVVAFFGELRP